MKIKFFGICILAVSSLLFLQCTKSDKKAESGNASVEKNMAEGELGPLAKKLKEKADASAAKTPAEIKKVMMDALEELKANKVAESAIGEGGTLPKFNLPDISRGNFNSKEMNEKSALVLVFYRGSWCPYCNLQLRDLQARLKDIKAAGGELVAISPETPDRTAKKVKEDGIEYYVLSDVNGVVSRKFGLSFTLPEDLRKVYLQFGINLEEANGNDKWELPIAATYVVNKQGKIVYAFLDNDYKKRAETDDIIKALKTL